MAGKFGLPGKPAFQGLATGAHTQQCTRPHNNTAATPKLHLRGLRHVRHEQPCQPQPHHGVEEVPAGDLQRVRLPVAVQLRERDQRARERHATDDAAQEDGHPLRAGLGTCDGGGGRCCV